VVSFLPGGRENRRLREDVEILKRGTAFFAKETR
jgi:transposase